MISARICTRSLASRFESGSSIRNTCGWRTIARPSATRWRWPPESACGLRFRYGSMPRASRSRLTRSSISAFGSFAQAQAEGDVVVDGHVRIERVVLEHHRDVAIARRHVVDDASPIASSPSVISSRPATIRSAVVLPQPDGPTNTMNSPSRPRCQIVDGPGAVRIHLLTLSNATRAILFTPVVRGVIRAPTDRARDVNLTTR